MIDYFIGAGLLAAIFALVMSGGVRRRMGSALGFAIALAVCRIPERWLAERF